jgi:hypothetical protein
MVLSTTATGNSGAITYNWTYNQTQGTTLSGVSITNGTSSVIFTTPNTVVYAGDNAVTGTFGFTVQCVATDSAISGCNQVRNIVLWFNSIPVTCNLQMTVITVS